MERIVNKKVVREYEVLDKYEAGIVLHGSEVKSMMMGRVRLEDSFVKIVGNEVFLVNADISPYQYADNTDYDSKRTRKLLLNKAEILRLKTKMTTKGNLTIMALACYNKKNLIKVEIALCKGRKTWEVKKIEKNRDEKRRVEKELKNF